MIEQYLNEIYAVGGYSLGYAIAYFVTNRRWRKATGVKSAEKFNHGCGN